jgi:hypothetical protein
VADDLIDAALDWPRQKADFVYDHGALVDIYIADTNKTDWTNSLALIFDGCTMPACTATKHSWSSHLSRWTSYLHLRMA